MGHKKTDAAAATPQGIEERLDQLTKTFTSRFDKLEQLLAVVTRENTELRDALAIRDKEILQLRERLNEQEQYGRSWSVRVLNLQLHEGESTDPRKVMQRVYTDAFLPILCGAQDAGELGDIPSCEELLETAHILPAKEGKIPAVICRFYSRNMRTLIFKMKKEHAPRHELTPPQAATRGRPPRLGKLIYPIYEDLTRPNFNKFRAISQRQDIESVWTINGSIRYRLVNSTTVHKVKTIFDAPPPPSTAGGDRTRGPEGATGYTAGS